MSDEPKPTASPTTHPLDETSLDKRAYYKDSGFRIWEIQRDVKLVPIKRKLDKKYGPGLWGWDEAVADMQERRERKRSLKGVFNQQRKQRLLTVEQRVDQYRAAFSNMTPNDETAIHQLATIEKEMAEIEDTRRMHAKGEIDVSIADLEKLGKLYINYSTEFRNLQKSLGIDRASRETDVDAGNEVRRFVEGSKKFLAEKTIPIRCPHCDAEHHLNLGYIYFAFQDASPWTFSVEKCPNCKKPFTINDTQRVQAAD